MTDVPASGSAAVAPFSFLGPDHPLAARLERFRAAIASRGLDVSGATVLADVTLRPEPDAGLVLHRAYWSAQWPGPEGFRATTLDYDASRDRARWLAFPDDPELPALSDPGGEVLRYVPLRRCTVRAADGVGKVKRPRRAAEAWALLGAVHRAVGHDREGFVVPAPLAYDPARATYSQTALEGDDLSAVIDDDHLRRAGELHRAMHAADVPDTPPEDPAGALAELRADARWVAFALPEHAGALRGVLHALERRAPPEPHVPAFCHGDPLPSQMLVGERWGITDFDGARIGDPHRDLAIWLASLAFDVPALRAAAEAGDERAVAHAEAAYLDGYGAHDQGRLLWHRAAAEVHYAAVALKKDRYHPALLARGLRLAGTCAETLR